MLNIPPNRCALNNSRNSFFVAVVFCLCVCIFALFFVLSSQLDALLLSAPCGHL